ncbi:MAG: NAD(P)/FAD-dependent oxidoreductase, partial [Clostridia bacterium]|nr:NAD(P)/FAD-dependent oxidoreductase [Clostridia bacterium]
LVNALDALLPKKMIEPILMLAELAPHKSVNQISKEERRRLVETLKDLTLTAKSFRPIAEAIITSGGVNVKEINPSTMESKLVTGLYFAGEVIDVDAYTGGFNLQIAFSSGYLAGENA